ncbi:hypothetical protein CPAV1605_1514 [seawater metagenome]|uniref:Uncharacterized protein n=1 Tax=seawater metagenome TaxID=1561972 RepID=A0A5E8CK92_9ZZZZ
MTKFNQYLDSMFKDPKSGKEKDTKFEYNKKDENISEIMLGDKYNPRLITYYSGNNIKLFCNIYVCHKINCYDKNNMEGFKYIKGILKKNNHSIMLEMNMNININANDNYRINNQRDYLRLIITLIMIK